MNLVKVAPDVYDVRSRLPMSVILSIRSPKITIKHVMWKSENTQLFPRVTQVRYYTQPHKQHSLLPFV